jgi:hypothetical protein
MPARFRRFAMMPFPFVPGIKQRREISADRRSAWIAGSFDTNTALRALCRLGRDDLRLDQWFVMAGLVPAIHVFALTRV